MANEIKRAYWGSQASPVASEHVEDGTFTLTFGGDTTDPIAFDASAATIKSALEALASVDTVDVQLTADGFTVEFQGSHANTDVGDLTCTPSLKQKADTVTVTMTQEGSAGVSEVQTINTGGATGGSYGLNYDGVGGPFTVAVTGDGATDVAALQAVLDANISTEIIATDETGGVYKLTFTGSLGNQDISNTVFSISDDSTTGGTGVTNGIDVDGNAGQPALFTISLPDEPTEGDFLLNDGVGNTDPPVAFNADSAAMETALRASIYLPNATVEGAMSPPFSCSSVDSVSVTLTGQDSTPLRKACAVEIVTTQEGSAGGGPTLPVLIYSHQLQGIC